MKVEISLNSIQSLYQKSTNKFQTLSAYLNIEFCVIIGFLKPHSDANDLKSY